LLNNTGGREELFCSPYSNHQMERWGGDVELGAQPLEGPRERERVS